MTTYKNGCTVSASNRRHPRKCQSPVNLRGVLMTNHENKNEADAIRCQFISRSSTASLVTGTASTVPSTVPSTRHKPSVLNRIGWLLVYSFSALCLFPAKAFSQQSNTSPPTTTGATSEHKALMNGVGTWDATMKIYVNGPDAEPKTATAVETNTQLGEFWLLSSMEYELDGQKIQGRGQFGFDPHSQKFIGTWCDSGSPHLSQLEGTWDAQNKTWTYRLQGRDQSGNPTAGLLVTKLHDANRKTFQMHMASPATDGKYIKVMDVEYRRRR